MGNERRHRMRILRHHGEAAREGVVSFGAFEINPEIRELRKHGIRIKLPEQSFQALVILIEAAGRLVSRDELRQRLWGEDVHVAYDRNLNSIIHTLREALGDSARNPRFVDTVPGQGYRFLAPVADPGAETESRRRKPARLGSLLVIAGLLAAGGYWMLAPAGAGPGAAPRLAPLTSLTGIEGHPSFSPDGSRIAFHWNGPKQGSYNIYVKARDSDGVVQMTSSLSGDRNPAWSPDGSRIAYLRTLPEFRSAIMVMPADGGEERTIAEIPTTESTLAWSADGNWLAYGTWSPDYSRNPPAESGIHAVSVETGRRIRITTPGALSQGDAYPAFSPDGRMLAFVRLTSFAAGDLFIVKLGPNLKASGALRRLTFDHMDARCPAWTPGEKSIVFSSNRSGYRSLWKVAVSGGATPVLLGGERGVEPAVSPSGEELAYARHEAVFNLWEVDLGDLKRGTAQPRQLSFTTRLERNVAFSPDGEKIAFGSNLGGYYEVWVCNRDGSDARRVTSFGGPESGSPRWSPDGQFLVCDSRVGGKGEIFVVRAQGGEPRRLTENPADDIVPSWSRDGKWVYFASNRTGAFQVWKIPSAGGEAVQVTRHGGFRATESLDRQYVYYSRSLLQSSIRKAPVDGGEETDLTGPLDYWANFSVGRRGIYFFSPAGPRSTTVRFHDLAAGKTSTLGRLATTGVEGMSISPDGRTVIFAKLQEAGSDLVLMSLK